MEMLDDARSMQKFSYDPAGHALCLYRAQAREVGAMSIAGEKPFLDGAQQTGKELPR